MCFFLSLISVHDNLVPRHILSSSCPFNLLLFCQTEEYDSKVCVGWPSAFIISLETLLQRLPFLPICLIYFPFIFLMSITLIFLNYQHERLPKTYPIVLKGIKIACGRNSKLGKSAFLKTFKNFEPYSSS